MRCLVCALMLWGLVGCRNQSASLTNPFLTPDPGAAAGHATVDARHGAALLPERTRCRSHRPARSRLIRTLPTGASGHRLRQPDAWYVDGTYHTSGWLEYPTRSNHPPRALPVPCPPTEMYCRPAQRCRSMSWRVRRILFRLLQIRWSEYRLMKTSCDSHKLAH